MTKSSATKHAKGTPSAEAQLKAFIAKFDAKDQRLIRAARKVMRARLPTANELVYDNYNFFVIGYGPTERPSDAILSLAAQANKLALCFLWGKRLPDPTRRLRGDGSQTRSLPLNSASDLSDPDVDALIAAAVDLARQPFPATGRGRLIIRSVSAKQRPRRKPAT